MSKVEEARSSLERLIGDGELPANGRLPPERDLCARLGVSRNTLRAALDLLEAEGKVWRRVGSGTYSGSRPPRPLEGLLAISDATNPTELMELRLMLEPSIARLAAMRATRSEVEYLRHCVRKCFAAPDSESYERWDTALHNAIAASTHNSLIVSTFRSINQLRRMTLWGQLRDRIVAHGKQRHWSSQHRDFVEAIAERDGKAAERLARQHVEDVFAQIAEA